MAITDDARLFARYLLEAGREPIWVLLVTSWYFGNVVGREAALGAIEERTGIDPCPRAL
jgi:hypothetical protein